MNTTTQEHEPINIIGGDELGTLKRKTAIDVVLRAVPLTTDLGHLTVVAPSPNTAGFACDMSVGNMVYLSPFLEWESQDRVNWTFAHEVAHIVLGHHKNTEETNANWQRGDEPDETGSNNLIASWGFTKPSGHGVFERQIAALINKQIRGDGLKLVKVTK
jgi:hypothetical protein